MVHSEQINNKISQYGAARVLPIRSLMQKLPQAAENNGGDSWDKKKSSKIDNSLTLVDMPN